MPEPLIDIVKKALAKERARSILMKNKDMPFVKRMLNPGDYPSKPAGNGMSSSHLMATAEVDGVTYAYPTLRFVGGKLVQDNSVKTAIDTNNAIAFDNPKDAEEFAQGSWKLLKKTKGKKR